MSGPNTMTIYQLSDHPLNRNVEFVSIQELQKQAQQTRSVIYETLSNMQGHTFETREQAARFASELSHLESINAASPEIILLRDSAGRDCAIHLCKKFDGTLAADYCDTKSLDTLVEPWRYKAIYTDEIPVDDPKYTEFLLEDIYERFNIHIPEDFRGHSLSMSDVIGLTMNGQTYYHYVDSYSFLALPDFKQEPEHTLEDFEMPPEDNRMWKALERESIDDTRTIKNPEPADYLRNAEMMMEDDYGMIDGIINNGRKEEAPVSISEQLKVGAHSTKASVKDHKAHSEPSL